MRRRDTGGQNKHNQEAKHNLLIFLIQFMAADVVISAAGAMLGDARQEASQQKGN